jgi:hypothetical protein
MRIERLRIARIDSAEAAIAGANGSGYKESGGALTETFTDIGTAGALAYGMHPGVTQDFPEMAEIGQVDPFLYEGFDHKENHSCPVKFAGVGAGLPARYRRYKAGRADKSAPTKHEESI